MLIVTRGLLGIAGAALAPATLSLVTTMFTDERQRTATIGVWCRRDGQRRPMAPRRDQEPGVTHRR